jgi:DNA-binding FadR family transcriptional regulator
MARAIGTEILAGAFPVGATLPNESDLMHRFGVSRTVVREVVKTLAAKGMVVSKTKVGTRVLAEANWNMFDADVLTWRVERGLDPRFVADLFEIRLAIEPAAAALAAVRRDADDIANLERLVARMSDGEYDSLSFAAVDVDFHLAVTTAARNPFMRSIGAVIKTALMHCFALVSPVDAAHRDASAEAHGRIVAAIAARDGDAAAAAMVAVIREGMRNRCSRAAEAAARAEAAHAAGNATTNGAALGSAGVAVPGAAPGAAPGNDDAAGRDGRRRTVAPAVDGAA